MKFRDEQGQWVTLGDTRVSKKDKLKKAKSELACAEREYLNLFRREEALKLENKRLWEELDNVNARRAKAEDELGRLKDAIRELLQQNATAGQSHNKYLF